MTAGWNFERRRDTCAAFVIGAFVLAKGLPEKDTSLEAVRNRMRLSPEEALFAARRLHEEKLLTFEAAGAVRSNARGIERAEALMGAVRAKMQRFDEVTRTLRAGGTPLAVLAAALRSHGAPVACGAPDDDAGGTYQLSLVDDVVTLERRSDDGAFEAVPVDA
jgi:hypothetical protein